MHVAVNGGGLLYMGMRLAGMWRTWSRNTEKKKDQHSYKETKLNVEEYDSGGGGRGRFLEFKYM